MDVRGFRQLYRFPGYVVKTAAADEALGEVTLSRDGRCRLPCPQCEGRLTPSRETPQIVRDLGWGPLPLVMVRYPAIQGRCQDCGRYGTVTPPGIGQHQKATNRLMHFASHLCRFMPVSRVAETLAVSDGAIRQWDKRVLRQTFGEPNLDGLEALLIDEKAIGRQHAYATVVLNAFTGELLHMHTGPKAEGIEAFLAKLTEQQKASIQVVGMDRDGAYRRAVTEHLGADIVYDKFHVIQNYNEVIDEVRRSEWRKAKAQNKPVIKGLRYILLKHPENRTRQDTARLEDALALNRNLAIVDVLKDDLRHLWTYRTKGWARRWLNHWIDWAWSTGLAPVQRFARGLRQSAEFIVNYSKHGITSGRLEGFNNLISRAIHRACGIKDLEYLFLKIRQESLS